MRLCSTSFVFDIDINVLAGRPSTVGSRAPRGLWSPAGQAGLVFPALIMLVAGQSPAEASEFNTGSTQSGQTRALPLSSSTCSARTSPSSILRHPPPVTRP